MKNQLLSIILLTLLTINCNSFANSMKEKAFDEVVAIAIQTLKEVS